MGSSSGCGEAYEGRPGGARSGSGLGGVMSPRPPDDSSTAGGPLSSTIPLMGRHDIDVGYSPDELRKFEERLLADAEAFEFMAARTISSRVATAVGDSFLSTSRQARKRSPRSRCRSARPLAASSSSWGGGPGRLATPMKASRRTAASSQASPTAPSGAVARGTATSRCVAAS